MNKVLLLIFLSLSLIVCKAQNKEILLDSVAKFSENNNWIEAEKYMSEVFSIDTLSKKNPMMLNNLATIQRYNGKYDESLLNYNKAILLAPKSSKLIHNRALLYMLMDSLEKANIQYEMLMKLDVTDEDAYYNHGMLALERGDTVTSGADFNHIIVVTPKSIMGYQGLAHMYKKTGNFRKAASYYTKVITNVDDPIARMYRAECYLRTKNLVKASEDIETLMIMTPTDPMPYVLRAILYKYKFETNKSQSDFKKSIELGLPKELALQLMSIE